MCIKCGSVSSHSVFLKCLKAWQLVAKEMRLSQQCVPHHVSRIEFHFLCFLTPAFTPCGLTSGSAITISIFFSASTANSANRLLMTNSPGFSSGSMVMLDMAAMLCFSHERGVTEVGARRLLTLLLTGAEAAEKTRGQRLGNNTEGVDRSRVRLRTTLLESMQCHALVLIQTGAQTFPTEAN